MKRSHTDNNKIGLLIISFLIIVGVTFTLSRFYKNFFVNIFSNTNTFFSSSDEKLSFANNENETLKNEIDRLQIIIKEKDIKEEEINSGMTDMIKADKISFDILNTDIIYSDIILSKGSNSGVSEGSKVYLSGMRIVGEVVEVFEDTSKLRLFSSNNLETELIIKNTLHASAEKEVKNEGDSLEINTESSSTKTEEDTSLDFKNLKDYAFSGFGDGAFGIQVKVPEKLSVKVGESVFLRGDNIHSVGTVEEIKNITSQKEKLLYIKTNYSKSEGSSFYILK